MIFLHSNQEAGQQIAWQNGWKLKRFDWKYSSQLKPNIWSTVLHIYCWKIYLILAVTASVERPILCATCFLIPWNNTLVHHWCPNGWNFRIKSAERFVKSIRGDEMKFRGWSGGRSGDLVIKVTRGGNTCSTVLSLRYPAGNQKQSC